MWAWLSDPGNQKTLAFLGGGVAAVVAAAWAVLKFFLKRPSVTIIAADRGGMAAGRDMNASQPPRRPKRRR